MREQDEIVRMLETHLRLETAPEGLWAGVRARLDESVELQRPRRRFESAWVPAMAAALAVLVAAVSFWSVGFRGAHRGRANSALDLQSYLAPVRNGSAGSSEPALLEAPPRFVSDTAARRTPDLAGYTVAARRVARVNGGTVNQVVMRTAGSAMALFIAPPRTRVEAGSEPWVEEKLGGMTCKRFDCPRVRMVQFRCLEETCVLLCKTCSEQAMRALMGQLTTPPLAFQ